VLAVQYESFINPFVIILTIPLSLIGVGAALNITNTPLSAPVMLGVILLAGIIVQNAILLVEFAEQQRAKGASLEDAVIAAGAVRLRPILMTKLTTILGMLPLALGIGSGTELMQPLAISVVGGILVATFLTLFVVPSAYVILNRGAANAMNWLTGTRPVPRAEEAEATGD
jgi:multidrug efflux pump subunit AcrB